MEVLMIGGSLDGKVLEFNRPEPMLLVPVSSHKPVSMKPEEVAESVCSYKCETELYKLSSMRGCFREFTFYLGGDVSIDDALQMLVESYVKKSKNLAPRAAPD